VNSCKLKVDSYKLYIKCIGSDEITMLRVVVYKLEKNGEKLKCENDS
jgi:hypothetical protein